MTLDDTLTLKVNGTSFQGWETVRVTRGVERFPSDFQIEVTETYPGEDSAAVARPGDPCEIHLGPDKVLTGYVDRYMPRISATGHSVILTGRSKCEDLVDCASLIKGQSTTGSSVVAIAKTLVAPFLGISVVPLSGDGTGQQFSLAVNNGESPYEIIETLARYEGLLVYDDTDGNLVLSNVGKATMASGFTQGVNVEAATAVFSMDERFDRYIAAIMSVDMFPDINDQSNRIGTVYDKSVPRYRPRIIVSEQAQNGTSLALIRANWELARRRGRSQAVTVVCDSWRDSGGKLWEPNWLVPVHIPQCKIINQTWCISEVSYERRDGSGTTAQLVLMPPEAFTPEPPEIQTISLQIARDIAEGQNPSARRDR